MKALLVALTLVLSAPVAATAQTAPAPASVGALRPDDRVVGSASAPVTLTAYVSTTCSHCADWHNNIVPQIMAKYVDTGQVKIVYRDLPTPPADVAAAGAVMARCVPAEKFDVALDSLYRGQAALGGGQTQEEQLQKITLWLTGAGVAGGLTRDQMNACFDDDANWTALEARVEAAHADGVTGTPTFFVNGVAADIDPHGLAAFDTVFQPLLARR